MAIGTFLAGFIIAFLKGWLLTFVMITVLPFLGFSTWAYMTAVGMQDKKMQKDYS